jgi:opacity protein-like surface antigen
MKRLVVTAVLFACAPLVAQGAAAGVGVRVNGAMSYISYGDFNDAVEYANTEGLWASGASGEISAIHWIPEFGGEVVVSVIPRLSLGVGAGIMYGKSSYVLQTGLGSYSYEHTIKAYPLTATAYVKLPPIPVASPYVYLGCGAYRTSLAFTESTSGASASGEASADLRTWGFGVHAGAGLSFAIVPRARFDIEVKWRHAVVKGFEGERQNPDGTTTSVYLASYTGADGAVTFAPEDVADKGSYAEGSADLSGVAFVLGFTIAF